MTLMKIAQDIVANVVFPKTKIAFGADGVAKDVSSAFPLPVSTGGAALPDGSNVMQIGSTQKKWIDEFSGAALNANKWDVATDVGAMGVTFSGSNLVVNMGTTINAEYTLLSKEVFTIPFDVQMTATLSQRIANNTFYMEAVEVDPTTLLPIVNANLAGDWANRAAIRLDGTSSSTTALEAIGDSGSAVVAASVSSQPTSSTATDYLMEIRPQDVVATAVSSNSGSSRGTMARVSQQVPDPNKLYKIRLRFKNGGSAPATATTITIGRVLVCDVQEIAVEIASGRGDASGGKGVPVNPTGTFSVRDVNGVFVEVTSAAITSTATATSASSPDNGGGASASFLINVTAVSGTNPTMDVGIEESDDSGTNWIRIWDMPRITATGAYRSPVLALTGNRFRFVQTIGGTTPSFTRAINRLAQQNVIVPLKRCFFDRALNINSIVNGAAGWVEGCTKFAAMVTLSSIGTGAPSLRLEFSDDNVNWYAGSAATPAIVGTLVLTPNITLPLPKYVRVAVTVAGTGAALTHICIKAQE
jgi:hypothetical protein